MNAMQTGQTCIDCHKALLTLMFVAAQIRTIWKPLRHQILSLFAAFRKSILIVWLALKPKKPRRKPQAKPKKKLTGHAFLLQWKPLGPMSVPKWRQKAQRKKRNG